MGVSIFKISFAELRLAGSRLFPYMFLICFETTSASVRNLKLVPVPEQETLSEYVAESQETAKEMLKPGSTLAFMAD
jgi:hypothetical protein